MDLSKYCKHLQGDIYQFQDPMTGNCFIKDFSKELIRELSLLDDSDEINKAKTEAMTKLARYAGNMTGSKFAGYQNVMFSLQQRQPQWTITISTVPAETRWGSKTLIQKLKVSDKEIGMNIIKDLRELLVKYQ